MFFFIFRAAGAIFFYVLFYTWPGELLGKGGPHLVVAKVTSYQPSVTKV